MSDNNQTNKGTMTHITPDPTSTLKPRYLTTDELLQIAVVTKLRRSFLTNKCEKMIRRLIHRSDKPMSEFYGARDEWHIPYIDPYEEFVEEISKMPKPIDTIQVWTRPVV